MRIGIVLAKTLIFAALTAPAHAGMIEDCNNAKWVTAVEVCTKVIEDPKIGKAQKAKAYGNRANAQKNDESAREQMLSDFEKAIGLTPNDDTLYASRSDTYPDWDTSNAIEDINKAIELQPKNSLWFVKRAALHVKAESFYKAESDYESAIKLDPKNPQLYEMRMGFYLEREEYDSALADSNSLIDLNFPSALFYQGHVYTRMGKGDEAIADMTKFLAQTQTAKKKDKKEEVTSDEVFAYGMRGLCYSNKKQFELAVADFSKAISGYDHIVLRNMRGNAFAGLKQYELAIEDFTNSIKKSPAEVQSYYLRASAYEMIGQNAKAAADRTEAAFLTAGLKKPKKYK